MKKVKITFTKDKSPILILATLTRYAYSLATLVMPLPANSKYITDKVEEDFHLFFSIADLISVYTQCVSKGCVTLPGLRIDLTKFYATSLNEKSRKLTRDNTQVAFLPACQATLLPFVRGDNDRFKRGEILPLAVILVDGQNIGVSYAKIYTQDQMEIFKEIWSQYERTMMG